MLGTGDMPYLFVVEFSRRILFLCICFSVCKYRTLNIVQDHILTRESLALSRWQAFPTAGLAVWMASCTLSGHRSTSVVHEQSSKMLKDAQRLFFSGPHHMTAKRCQEDDLRWIGNGPNISQLRTWSKAANVIILREYAAICNFSFSFVFYL